MIDLHIGKPYSFRDFNCWHYAVLIRKENNIKTKMFAPRNMSEAFKTVKAEMQKLGHGLVKVSEPENFDIIIASRKKAGIEEYHCGIYIDGSVAHCCRSFGAVRASSFDEFTKDYEAFTIWR